MQALLSFINGRKTYLLAILGALVGVSELPSEPKQALLTILAAAIVAALRHGIAKGKVSEQQVLNVLEAAALLSQKASHDLRVAPTPGNPDEILARLLQLAEQAQSHSDIAEVWAELEDLDPEQFPPDKRSSLIATLDMRSDQLRERIIHGPYGFLPWTVLALGLLAPSIASALEKPRIVVNGPTTGVPGEILTFDFSQSEGEELKFRVVVHPEIKGYRHLYHDSPTATRANVAGFPGTYRVRIQAWNSEGIDEWERDITIPGNPPCPPPAPDPPKPQPEPLPVPPAPTPTPTPDPQPKPDPMPKPDPNPAPTPEPPGPPGPGEFNIAPAIYAEAKRINDPEGTKRLATMARSIAAKISAGAYRPHLSNGNNAANDVLKEIVSSVRSIPSWVGSLAKLAALLKEIVTVGKLADLSAWARLLREIADALDAAAV